MRTSIVVAFWLILNAATPAIGQENWTITIDSTHDKWSGQSRVVIRTSWFRTTHSQIAAQGVVRLCDDYILCNRLTMHVRYRTGPNPSTRDRRQWREMADGSFCADYLMYPAEGAEPKRGYACEHVGGAAGRDESGRLFVIRIARFDPDEAEALLEAYRAEFRAAGLEFAITPAIQGAFRALADTVQRRVSEKQVQRRSEFEQPGVQREAERAAKEKTLVIESSRLDSAAAEEMRLHHLEAARHEEAPGRPARTTSHAFVRPWIGGDLGFARARKWGGMPVGVGAGLAIGPIRVGAWPLDMLFLGMSNEGKGALLFGYSADGRLSVPLGRPRLMAGAGFQKRKGAWPEEEYIRANFHGTRPFWVAGIEFGSNEDALGTLEVRWLQQRVEVKLSAVRMLR